MILGRLFIRHLALRKESPIDGCFVNGGTACHVLTYVELTALEFSCHGVCRLIFLAERGGGNHADNYKTGAD